MDGILEFGKDVLSYVIVVKLKGVGVCCGGVVVKKLDNIVEDCGVDKD